MVKLTTKEEDQGYTVGTWKGLPHYRCLMCTYETLHEDEMKEHIKEKHTPSPDKKTVNPKIVDRFGRSLKEDE